MANPLFPMGNVPLADADPEVADLVEKEKNRQWRGIELIASEVCLHACLGLSCIWGGAL